MIVLPLGRRLSLASLQRIVDYVQRGGSVVGPAPLGPTGILDEQGQRQFSELVQAMWNGCSGGSHPHGSGTVFCDTDSRAALKSLHVLPDFDSSSGQLDYIHRADAQRDIYFVRNGRSSSVDTVAQFRVTGRTAEIWNAVDGTITLQNSHETEDGRTRMPLHLDPFGSAFVIFERKPDQHATELLPAANASHGEQVAPSATTLDLPASNWTIAFQPDRGTPTGPQPLREFQSWTASPNAGIRYFSGTATYRTQMEVNWTASERVFLTLTDLREICTVRVNGKDAGTIWAMPYRLDITDSLNQGHNTLEIDVTNLWPNRIIGDAQPGVSHTYTRTNIRKYTADSPLLPSGLIGPVSLQIVSGTKPEASSRN